MKGSPPDAVFDRTRAETKPQQLWSRNHAMLGMRAGANLGFDPPVARVVPAFGRNGDLIRARTEFAPLSPAGY